MRRILFVCLGNICRSPSAEGVFAAKARLAGLEVGTDSAGTANYHFGKPPYGPMQEAARGRGYDLSGLRARQFSARDFGAFDLIIAMDRENQSDIEALRPNGDETPVRLMMEFAPETGVDEVPDPYYTRDFNEALALIENASDGLIVQLSQAR